MHSLDERRLAGRGWAVSGAHPAKKLATAVPAAPRGAYEEIRTPWRHATIHLKGAIPTQRASRADPGGGREDQLNRRLRMSPPAAAISPSW